MNYDFSAFSGHWPYRRVRNGTFPDQLRLHEEAHISGGVMSSLEAIFYNDPWEADLPLLEALPERWRLAMCVNPELPWSADAVKRAHERNVKFLRLYPCIHGYALKGAVDRLCELAGQYGMTVLLTARMEDDRLCYLLEQHAVSPAECAELAQRHPGANFLLSGFHLHELTEILPPPENVWADTAGLCHGLDPVDDLIAAGFPEEKLVFGSFAPLQCMESHLLNLPEDKKETILSRNGQCLLEVNE